MPVPSKEKSSPQVQIVAGNSRKGSFGVFICAFLAVVTLGLFWPVQNHDFINYDDPDYLTANPIVQKGVTWEGLQWAFASSHAFNWHPITWISHMLDASCFGMNPGAHHLVSVGFHIANSLLLFLLFWRTTKQLWPAGIAAALFAWHPLHVESVAWACERKDVLSTFFWLLTTLFYVRYVREGSRPQRIGHYWMAVGLFALGLMSKPMLVTLPFTLLLLDLWPLHRVSLQKNGPTFNRLRPAFSQLLKLTGEKWPFFALSVGSSIVTFLVQRTEGAVVALEHLPLTERLQNTIVSYARYLGKTVCPTELTIYYPPESWAPGQVLLSIILLLGLSVLAVVLLARQPAVFVGWFWFLGTLVPVIGIVQVGAQSIADRYMYVPMIGLGIAALWPLHEFLLKRHWLKFATLPALSVLLLLGWVSANYLRVWRNSETVFSHALRQNPNNVVAGTMLANSFLAEGKYEDAEKAFQQVLAINPSFPEIHFNLGNLYVQQQRSGEAIAHYEAALSQNPNYAEAHANLGVALGMEQRWEEAIVHYDRSLALQPAQPDLLRNVALDLISLQRFTEAVSRLESALALDPADATAWFLLGNAHLAARNTAKAGEAYAKVLELKPDWTEARERLAALNAGR